MAASFPSKSSPKTPHFRQRCKQVLIALVSFMVTASLLHQIIPSGIAPPNVSIIGPKYEYYQAHKDEYTALFFGSSRVHYHISPEVFDQVAGEAGVPVKSFNFGVAGIKPMQVYVLLRDILQDPPPNLKWVFCEDVLDWGGERVGSMFTHSAMYWHTAENTRLAIAYVLSVPYSNPLEKAGYALSHIVPFVLNQLNVSRVFYQWVPNLHFSSEDKEDISVYLANEGYRPLDQEVPTRAYFLNNLERYQQEVNQLAEEKRIPINPEEAPYFEQVEQPFYRHLERIMTDVEKAGATPIFVVAPTTVNQEPLRRASYLKKIPYLLSFNHPDNYPELFDVDYREEWDHLNPQGAEHFTQLLAKQFVEVVLTH